MSDGVVNDVCAWYAAHARDLPWRRPEVTPWGVLVSEFMLLQTPVARVLGPWREWIERWPTATSLADATSGDAVRAWGRLGYPRRAQRLHVAAVAIRDRHAGDVPSDLDALRALPGVGEYTAAAIASFGFGQRQLVLDTNVRRVLARLDAGVAHPPFGLTVAERRRAAARLPDEPASAALWAVASMELGAQLCTASNPDCDRCPIADRCRWLASGRPASDQPRRGQTWHGTDRQCRGVLLEHVRSAARPPTTAAVLASWPADAAQALRCLDSLLADGLVHLTTDQRLDL